MIIVAGIFFLFAFIHSITITRTFKEACKRRFGDTFMRVYYRAVYNVVSVATAAAAFSWIRTIPDRTLWTEPLWLRLGMYSAQAGALLFASRAFDYLDSGEFLGIKQIRRYLRDREIGGNIEGLTQKDLVTRGVYGIVRHPLYVAGIVFFTCNPHITVNGLTVTVLADAYFLFGMFIEERRFVTIFEDQYREYMKQVPRMIPRVGKRGKDTLL
ncbi:MAG TPA: isoprenylcysteine carboxylmethyltransferase family protein [Nitrospirota bacterium]|nr:isoprenylcysteine carboxylmethyltransferase family protein [Nitrospirota bacterium]